MKVIQEKLKADTGDGENDAEIKIETSSGEKMERVVLGNLGGTYLEVDPVNDRLLTSDSSKLYEVTELFA